METGVLTNDKIIEYIVNNVRATHNHIALLLKELYSTRYCTCIYNNNAQWYEFNGSYWQLDYTIKHHLNLLLSTDVVNYVYEARTLITNRLQNPISAERVFEESLLKELHKLTEYLFDNTFKSGVLKECEALFLRDINRT